MNNVIKDLKYYVGLPYTIILEKYDDQGGYWVARVAELPFCMIHGNTPEEALKDIEQIKMEWIQSNLEEGHPIPEQVNHNYSGEIRVRMPPTLHRFLSDRAMIEEVSLNQFMVMALARAVGYPEQEKKTNSNSVIEFRYEPNNLRGSIVTESKTKYRKK
jgi:antitoxin HicB